MVILVVIILSAVFTEFTSNLACASILFPILDSIVRQLFILIILTKNSLNTFRHIHQEFMQRVLYYHHVWLFLFHLCYLLVCFCCFFPLYVNCKTTFVLLATPPNAMIFSSGSVRIIDLIKVGLVMKLIGIGIILLASMTMISPIFRIHQLASFVNETSSLNGSLLLV